MGSLARCLKKVGLDKHEAAILRGAVDDYVKEGKSAQEAALTAVLDYIEDVLAERADIVEQIKAAGGVAPSAAFTIEAARELAKTAVKDDIDRKDVATAPVGASNNPVDIAAHEAATSPKNDLPDPTPAMAKAGNYRKGHTLIGGMNISIENPAGSTRSGTDPNGKAWSVTLKSHYGYILGTKGRDKDHIDIFVKPGTPENYDGPVFVIDQKKPGNGHFDEHKIMMGWATEADATAAYLSNYQPGWQGLGEVTQFTVPGLKAWLAGDTTRPAALAKSAEAADAKDAEKSGRSETTPEQREERTTASPEQSGEDLDAMFDDILAEEVAKDEAKTTGKKIADEIRRARARDAVNRSKADRDGATSETERTAADAAKSAAKNIAAGFDAAIDGLGKLFGAKGTLGSGPVFDEETYAKAKPLFQQAVAHFADAAADIADVMRAVIRAVLDRFGANVTANMKPYVVRFIKDVQSGAVLIGKGDKDDRGTEVDGRGSLEDVAPEEVEGADRERQSGRGAERGGTRGGEGDARADGGRGEGLRGQGDRPTTVDSTAAGEQDVGEPGGRPRAGRDGEGVPGAGRERAGDRGKSDARVDGGRAEADRGGAEADRQEIAPPQIPSIDFTITEDVRLGSGGAITKYNDNVAAIRVLKQIEAERRRATPEEQRILARYVGWGGLPNAFRNVATGEVKPDWEQRVAELESLLMPEELKAARASTRNAHFTSQEVAEFMWKAVHGFGFRGGLVLEPSVGVGNFIGLMPEALRGNSHVTGIELDSLTSRIAAALYPQSNIINAGFQTIPIPSDTFDLAIGNPPFGKESLRFNYLPELNGVSIHNQFFRASIDAVRPGGILAMVVSRYLMDAQDVTNRRELAARAKFLGAVRLPGSAFKGNALTEVVTDVIFLQRRVQSEEDAIRDAFLNQGKQKKTKESDKDRLIRLRNKVLLEEVSEWLETRKVQDDKGNPMVVNRYFAEKPEMIAGIMDTSGTQNREGDIGVRLRKGEDLASVLKVMLARLPQYVTQPSKHTAAEVNNLHNAMGESLKLYAQRREVGSIQFEEDGTLTKVVERIMESGETVLTTIPVTPSTPWSSQLYMNLAGKWYRNVVKLDSKGAPVKMVIDGKVTKLNQYTQEIFERESDIPNGLRLGQSRFERLQQLILIRDLLLKQINLEIGSSPAMEVNRSKLHTAYYNFVKRHGYISDPKNADIVSEMPDEGMILSLETNYKRAVSAAKAKATGMKPAPSSAKPAAILSRPVAIPPRPVNHADTIQDAIALSLAETGRLDLARIVQLRGLPEDEVIAELTQGDDPLAYRDPEAGMALVEKNEYLSGNVRRKLNAAREAELRVNVAALEKVQPEPWSSDKIAVRLGANWVPPEVYTTFLRGLIDDNDAKVTYSRITNTFSVFGGKDNAASTSRWGTNEYPAPKLLETLLNSSRIDVTRTAPDGSKYKDQEAIDAANDKANEMHEEFSEWVFRDAERRRELTKLFNDLFNVRVRRQYDGSHMQFPGKVPDSIIKLRRGQVNAIWRGIVDKAVLFDHAVGAGKTMAGIARAMERRRMGLSRKPMVVVPNHLVKPWATEAYRLYPGAKVLAFGATDLDAKSRRRAFARIATGDWDVVIVPHSSFEFISVSLETEERFLMDELALAEQGLKDAEATSDIGRRKPLSVKKAEALVEKLRTKLEKLHSNRRKDKLLTFEQMGVDDLTIDESHEFKNLMYTSNLTNVRGMGSQTGSQKALDLYMKTRVLREYGGSIAFMTGTPISNSAVEIYNILRYLAPNELQDVGLEHFDAFRSMHVSAKAGLEPTESGSGLKMVTRLGREWTNMRSMMEIYYSVADVVTNEDIKAWYREDNPGKEFPLPKVKGDGRQAVAVQPTPSQDRLLKQVVEGFNNLPKIADTTQRNKERLRLMDRARKVSLHARALDPLAPDEYGGKLDKAAEEITRIYKKWDADRGTQLVFLDRGVPKSKGDDKKIKEYDELVARREKALAENDEEAYRRVTDALDKYDANEIEELRRAQAGGWNGYDHLRGRLIKAGIPENEIAYIQNYNTDADKKALFDAVNDGRIRVLIGSTPRMGAGTNVQERLVALHHIDATWKPSDIEQREGRIIRQGNLLLEKYGDDFEVEILAYVTERTIDAKLWDLNATKLRMVNAIRHYDGEFEMNFDDDDAISMAEIAAIASGDTLLLERFRVSAEVEQLQRLKKSWLRRVQAAEDELEHERKIVKTWPEKIQKDKLRSEAAQEKIDLAKEHAANRRVKIGDKEFSSLFDALMHMGQTIKEQRGEDGKGKISLIIDGNTITSQAEAEERIRSALGDENAFIAEVDGNVFIRRAELAEHLSEHFLGNAFEEKEPVPIGTIMGVPVTIEIYRSRVGALNLLITGPLKYGNGEAVTIDGNYELPKKADRITAAHVRSVISAFGVDLKKYISLGDESSQNLARHRIEEAKKNIPVLEQEAAAPFKHEEALEQKKALLADLEQQLEARAQAAENGGVYYKEDGEDRSASRFLRDTGGNINPKDLSAVVAYMRDAFPGLRIHALESEEQAPDTLRQDIKAEGAENDVAGALHKGEVYLFRSNLRNIEHAERAFIHEATHAGLRRMFGSAIDPVMHDIHKTNLKVQIRAAKLKSKYRYSVARATEEVLADMGSEATKLTGWEKLVAWMRRALRRAGFVSTWTDNDVEALVLRALAAAKNPGNHVLRESDFLGSHAPITGGLNGIFSRNAPIPEINLIKSTFDRSRLPALRRAAAALERPEDGVHLRITNDGEVIATGPKGTRIPDRFVRFAADNGLTFIARRRLPESTVHGPLPTYSKLMPVEYRESGALYFNEMGEAWLDRTDKTRFSRVEQDDPQSIAARVEEILSRPTRRQGPVNEVVRIATQLVGIDRATRAIGAIVRKVTDEWTPEAVKAGMVSDYGNPEEVVDHRDQMFGHIRKLYRDVQSIIDRLANLTREESRIAYEWMHNRDADHLLDKLPESSRATLLEVKNLIASLGLEAVRLNMLDARTYLKHVFAYLHISYRKWEFEQTEGERRDRAAVLRILGDQFMARGLKDLAPMSSIKSADPEFWGHKMTIGKADKMLRGKRFIRFERRDVRGEGVGVLPGMPPVEQGKGKLREVHYWPEDKPVPARYGGWYEAGVWEVFGTQKDRYVMRRDFTKEEREHMGEIDEVRFAITKTLHKMIHDIEIAKHLSWLASHYASVEPPRGVHVIKAKEALHTTFNKNDWVQVPKDVVGDTNVKKYGHLAGLYVPAPIWNDIRHIMNYNYQPFGETYAIALRAWKISKTVLTPAVHMNNIMSNFIFADWYDLTARDIIEALHILISKDPAHKKIVEIFEDAGGTQGMYVLSELQRDQLAPLIEQLRAEVDQAGEIAGHAGVGAIIQAALSGRIREAYNIARNSKAGRLSAKSVEKLMEIYQGEDAVFRLAAFIKAKREGKSDAEAGKAARKSFLDYHINAPWINFLRNTFLPFIAFNYRAVPRLLEIAEKKPWKLIKLKLFIGTLNAIGYALSGGDEEEERRFMPEEKSSQVLGMLGPRMVRMPFNDEHGSPVFLDIRRFIPLGDFFDVGQTHSALPILPAMVAGGPAAIAMEFYDNKSHFTGKEIVKDTDTIREAVPAVLDHLYKAFAPNIPILPGTYAFDSIRKAATTTDIFGRKQSVPMAVASSMGIKLGAHPIDVLQYNASAKLNKQLEEIMRNEYALRSEFQKGGLSMDQFRNKMEYQREKKEELIERFHGR